MPVREDRGMTAAVVLLLVLTLVVAAVDWIAVYSELRWLEYVTKPLAMVTLIGAVLAMEPASSTARAFFVAALVFSMFGDIFLMFKRDELFVFGLGSFLIGHLAYIPGLWLLGVTLGWLVVGVVLVGISAVTIGLRVVRGVKDGSHAELLAPVVAYMGVISFMVVSAVGTGRVTAIGGAVLFYASDALIAWTRFIQPRPWGPMVIIITYHLGQIGLACSLVLG